jgi:DNA-binding NarL/FixJ family response regulator
MRGALKAPVVLALAARATIPDAVQAMRHGAFHFLARPCRMEEIERLIREAVEARRQRSKGRLEAALGAMAADTRLTRREIEIIRALAEGLSNRAIAERLAITEHTVKTHLKNIFGKLNARSRTEILSFVFRLLDEGAGA